MEPVVIVGAGPAGLATAASCRRRGVTFALWDRTGKPGGAFAEMPRAMKFLSPRRYVNLPHWPYPGAEEYPAMPDYHRYLEAYAARFQLEPERREITALHRTANHFELRCAGGTTVTSRFVVIATGQFGHPIWPAIPGLTPSPRVVHARDWTDAAALAGQRVVIIGAGISGVGIAEESARAGAQVFVSRRGPRTRLAPARILGRDILDWFRPLEFLPRAFFAPLCNRHAHAPAYDHGYRALRRAGKIVELGEIRQIDGTTVQFADGTRHDADLIVVATGYRYATPFLPAEIPRATGGLPRTADNESLDWPGLFFVGAPCARRSDSEFLRGIASDARRVAGMLARRQRDAA